MSGNLISLSLLLAALCCEVVHHARRRWNPTPVLRTGDSKVPVWVRAALPSLLLVGVIVSQLRVAWFHLDLGPALRVVAMLLGMAGIALLVASHVSLGGSWSPGLRITRGQQLVRSGVYRYSRHPMCLATTCVLLSILVLDDFVPVKAACALLIAASVTQIPDEERMLAMHFQREWVAYANYTGRMLPRLTPLRAVGARSRRSFLIMALWTLGGLGTLLVWAILRPWSVWELPLVRALSVCSLGLVVALAHRRLYLWLFDLFPAATYLYGLHDGDRISLHIGKNVGQLKRSRSNAFGLLFHDFCLCLALLGDGVHQLGVFKRSPKTLRATSSLLWVEKGGRGRPNPYFEKAGEKYLPKYSIRPEPASAPTKRAAMLRWILDGTAARRSGTTVGVAEIDVADRWSIDTQYERSLFAVEEPS